MFKAIVLIFLYSHATPRGLFFLMCTLTKVSILETKVAGFCCFTTFDALFESERGMRETLS